MENEIMYGYRTFWTRIDLRDLRRPEIEDIKTRLRATKLSVDLTSERDILVDTGVAVAPSRSETGRIANTIQFRAFQASSTVSDIAAGRSAALPFPAVLEDHTFNEDADVPRGFEPVSNAFTSAWFLERSLFFDMKLSTPFITDVVKLYLRNLSKIEQALGIPDDKGLVLKVMREYWDRGDVGCAEILRNLLRPASYASLRVEDPKAAEIRMTGKFTRRVEGFYNPFLFGLYSVHYPNADDAMMRDANQIKGLFAGHPRPDFLEGLSLSDKSEGGEFWTHPNTDARAVEQALINQQPDGFPRNLVRLYLREISETQKIQNIDGAGADTLRFILDNWELGDVGAGRSYAEQLAANPSKPKPKPRQKSKSKPKPNAKPKPKPKPKVSATSLKWAVTSNTGGIESKEARLADGSKLRIVVDDSHIGMRKEKASKPRKKHGRSRRAAEGKSVSTLDLLGGARRVVTERGSNP